MESLRGGKFRLVGDDVEMRCGQPHSHMLAKLDNRRVVWLWDRRCKVAVPFTVSELLDWLRKLTGGQD